MKIQIKILILVFFSALIFYLLNSKDIHTKAYDYSPLEANQKHLLVAPNKGAHARYVYLMDHQGDVKRTWSLGRGNKVHRIAYLNKDRQLIVSMKTPHKEIIIKKFDWGGNEIESMPHYFHHEIIFDKNHLYSLTRENISNTRLLPSRRRADVLVKRNLKGEIIYNWMLINGLDEIKNLVGLEYQLKIPDNIIGSSWLHANSIQILPETKFASDARFRPGNILLSYRNINTIAIFNQEQKKIVWAWGPKELDLQHMPRMQPNGNILIFDNGTIRGFSRILEMNPLSREIVWQYRFPEELFAQNRGSVVKASDNNYLVATGNGFAFEVNKSGELLWKLNVCLAVEKFLKRKPPDKSLITSRNCEIEVTRNGIDDRYLYRVGLYETIH